MLSGEDGDEDAPFEGRGWVGQGNMFSQTPDLQNKSKMRRKQSKGEQLI